MRISCQSSACLDPQKSIAKGHDPYRKGGRESILERIHSVEWKASLDLVTQEQLVAIHEATLTVLDETGIVMPLDAVRRSQAQDMGVRADGDRLFFPPEAVEEGLRSVPRSYRLCARDPQYDLPLDGRHGYLTLDGCGVHVFEPETGLVRPSTKADLEQAALMADGLPQIGLLWPVVSAQDCPAGVRPLYELEALLNHSSKHLQAMTAVDALNAKGSVEMAAAVVGGREKLKERPILSTFQCSLSPLCYDRHSLEAAWVFAEAGLPVGFMTMQIGGSTAPVTLAGNLVVGNAEILAGITLLQLLYPGTPTFYGSCATMMERRGGITSGGPEDFLLQAACASLAHYYGLPANVGTFATSAKRSDWHAGVENGIAGAVSLASRVEMMCGAGLLSAATIFSPVQLLLDCETFEILRRFVQGFEVTPETLALGAIQAVGPRGHFLLEKHTLNHIREAWRPSIIDQGSYGDWLARGSPEPERIAYEKAQELLKSHRPAELENREEVAEILSHYENLATRPGHE